MIGPIKLSEIEELAPMPVSVARLCAMMSDPHTTAAEIARVVELDQAMTANALRLANSAWSGLHEPIVTVRRAVVRLGTARVLGLALGGHVSRYMSQSFGGYELTEHELWRHSVAAALAVENLSHFSSREIPAAAFSAALVHDIGKLLLARHIDSEVLNRIRETMQDEPCTYLEAERKALGTDHAEVGGAIARHWRFPDELAIPIEAHHDPDAHINPVSDAVHIGNAVAKLIGVGQGSEQMNMTVSADAHKRFGLTSTCLEKLCAVVKAKLTEAERLYGSTDSPIIGSTEAKLTNTRVELEEGSPNPHPYAASDAEKSSERRRR